MPTTDEEVARLKEATREAHEALKDLKRGVEEAKEAHRLLHACVEQALNDGIGKQVQEGLDEYKESLAAAIDGATEAVYKRFDQIADILTGEDKQSKRAGKPSIPDLVRRRAQIINSDEERPDATQ